MKSMTKKAIVFSLAAIMNLGLGVTLTEASPAHHGEPRMEEHHDHHREREERQRRHDKELREEDERHEREMRRHEDESWHSWRHRQDIEEHRHKEELNRIEIILHF